jgi:hypothetical protein
MKKPGFSPTVETRFFPNRRNPVFPQPGFWRTKPGFLPTGFLNQLKHLRNLVSQTIPSPFSRRSGGTQWNPTYLLGSTAFHPTYKERYFYFGEGIVKETRFLLGEQTYRRNPVFSPTVETRFFPNGRNPVFSQLSKPGFLPTGFL